MTHGIPLSRISSLGLWLLTLLFLLGVALRAQAPQDAKPAPAEGKPTVTLPAAAKEMKPTEVQSYRLQLKQKDAIIAKQRLEALQTVIQGAQADYQRALLDLTAEADKVKVEQHWPADTQFSPNDLTFVPAPPPAPKKEVPKP